MPYSSQKSQSQDIAENAILSYLPAQLKQLTKEWLIEYFVLNPQTGKMQRVRMRLNKLRKRCKLKEFKQQANEMVIQINNRLAGGWSPLMESDNLRLYTKLENVLDEYLDEKRRELRPDTMRSYNSFCKLFKEYIHDKLPNIYASLFNRTHAIVYMSTMYKEKEWEAVTYNSRLKDAHAFFSWAKEQCYVKDNPFDNIKTKREKGKKRILIDVQTRQLITEYLKEKDPYFLLVCQLMFVSLIRPKEIRNIRIGDVSLYDKCIFVSSDNAKNHHQRPATINQEIIDLILDLHIDKFPKGWYLIGGHLKPAATPASHSIYGKHWVRMRKAIGFSTKMQLYSLRDTGINNMLKAGIDPLTVMQHADHHDLSMTTRYANHADPKLVQTIYEKAPKF